MDEVQKSPIPPGDPGSPGSETSEDKGYTLTVTDSPWWVPSQTLNCPVKIYQCGNVVEIHYSQRVLRPPPIQRVNADWYVNTETGEAFQYKHGEHYGSDYETLKNSFMTMRRKVNTTVTDARQCRFITLTYAHDVLEVKPEDLDSEEWDSLLVEEDQGDGNCITKKKYFKKVPMTDTRRLYMDFKRFMTRFRRYNDAHGWGPIGYIAAAEPQGNPRGITAGPGSWHMHVIMFWEDQKAPFLPNSDVAAMWEKGFVNVRGLSGVDLPNGKHGAVDNLGAYLTWYLSTDRTSKKSDRLIWYPKNFHPFRYSRNCKEPTIINTYSNEIKKNVGDLGQPTFHKSYNVVKMLADGHNEIYNHITVEYYNKSR